MNWLDEVTVSVFNDAWKTLTTHFRADVTLEHWLTSVRQGEYKMFTVRALIALGCENLAAGRLEAESAAKAYPPADRPRGAEDLKSIKYHRAHACSPVVIVKIGARVIFLDGMHRAVAASLEGIKIRACIVTL
jgi:hypothetical protein